MLMMLMWLVGLMVCSMKGRKIVLLLYMSGLVVIGFSVLGRGMV